MGFGGINDVGGDSQGGAGLRVGLVASTAAAAGSIGCVAILGLVGCFGCS